MLFFGDRFVVLWVSVLEKVPFGSITCEFGSIYMRDRNVRFISRKFGDFVTTMIDNKRGP